MFDSKFPAHPSRVGLTFSIPPLWLGKSFSLPKQKAFRLLNLKFPTQGLIRALSLLRDEPCYFLMDPLFQMIILIHTIPTNDTDNWLQVNFDGLLWRTRCESVAWSSQIQPGRREDREGKDKIKGEKRLRSERTDGYSTSPERMKGKWNVSRRGRWEDRAACWRIGNAQDTGKWHVWGQPKRSVKWFKYCRVRT